MAAEPRGREGVPKSASRPTCPTCAKELDPLRAGQVAILDGQFLYFCNQACKADYFQVISSRLTIDARCAESMNSRASGVNAPPVMKMTLRASFGRIAANDW